MVAFWALGIFSTTIIVGCLLVLLDVVLPTLSTSSTSRNYISNNPLKTGGTQDDGVAQWLTDYSQSALPVNCHSHNDYLRPHPVFSALVAGCTSIEADVWLSEDGDLLVGHHKGALSLNKTLQTLYIDPLVRVLSALNQPSAGTSNNTSNDDRTDRPHGVFRTDPNTTTILLIDVKSDAATTWPVVLKQLEPLRKLGFLSSYNGKTKATDPTSPFVPGAVTVVATGNMIQHRDIMVGSDAPAWREYHDTFLDAPLDKLQQHDSFGDSELGWGRDEFYTASVSFADGIGPVTSILTKHQLATLRGQIAAANERNLTSRYWDLPFWPISHRDYVWKTLVDEGIGLLNADDVQSAAKREWRNWAYVMEVIWMCATSAYLCISLMTIAWMCHRIVHNQRK